MATLAVAKAPYCFGGAPRVPFRSWYHTEDTGATYDTEKVYFTRDGSVWTLLAQVSGASHTWQLHSAGLAAHAGASIRLKFEFNTADGWSNNSEGWYVDDILILRS